MSDSDATPDGVIVDSSDATPTDSDVPPPLPPEVPEPCWTPPVLKAFQDFKTTLDKLQVEERTHLVFQIMGACAIKNGRLQLMLFGEPVSVAMFTKALGISLTKYYRLQHHLLLGYRQPPADGRHDRVIVDAPALQHADAWMNWCFYSLAEPLAEMEVKDFDDEVDFRFPETAPVA